MKEESTLDRALADLFAGNPPEMLDYILGEEGVTPEMMQIKKVINQDDLRKNMHKEAFEKVSNEAAKGNLFGVAHLGFLYLRGCGVKKNPQKAVELFEKSAASNNALGLHWFGRCLVYGVTDLPNFKTDSAKGIELLKKAADQNFSWSIGLLAEIYEEGKYIQKDVARAYELYTKAAKLGHVGKLKKLTQRASDTFPNPFYYYTPTNLDFTYELFLEKRANVTGSNGSISTNYKAIRFTMTITYTGPVEIGDRVICVRDMDSNCFDWNAVIRANDYNPYAFLATSEARVEVLGRHILRYNAMKAMSGIIQEADNLISERTRKAQQQSQISPSQQAPGTTAGYGTGGAFFAERVNSPFMGNTPEMPAPQQPAGGMTPDQMMQMMQQNPQFAAQVTAMMNQFQAMTTQQPSQDGNNNNSNNHGSGY